MNQDTLPEGQEDDGFDDGKFEDGIVWCQQFFSGKVEEEQGVESERDGYIVDDCDVQIT